MCTVCVCYKEDADTPTKEEYEVAKFLRFNIPSKEGKLMGMAVQYFLGKCHSTQVKLRMLLNIIPKEFMGAQCFLGKFHLSRCM